VTTRNMITPFCQSAFRRARLPAAFVGLLIAIVPFFGLTAGDTAEPEDVGLADLSSAHLPSEQADAPPGVADFTNLEFRDTDLATVLRTICKGADLDFVLDPTVRGKVTAKLNNTTWENALDIILKGQGLTASREQACPVLD